GQDDREEAASAQKVQDAERHREEQKAGGGVSEDATHETASQRVVHFTIVGAAAPSPRPGPERRPGCDRRRRRRSGRRPGRSSTRVRAVPRDRRAPLPQGRARGRAPGTGGRCADDPTYQKRQPARKVTFQSHITRSSPAPDGFYEN